MKWYSKLAIVTLVVLAVAVIQDSFTPREASATGTTMTKNTGQYFFSASDTITSAGGVKVIRWPHKNNEVQTFVTTGDSSTSATFTYFISDKPCTLDVFTRSAPDGSLQVVLSSQAALVSAELEIEGLPVDSLRITVTTANTRFWVTAYR